MAGLGSALACARDGHEVTILERDATPMPESADAAFAWERRGAPQVRHSHAFLARLRNLLRDRAPDVLEALFAAGATELHFTATLPDTLTDTDPRPGDEDLVALACRRTTFEWVLRRLVLAQPGVELRDGVGVTDWAALDGDLVLDARGPRSTADWWTGPEQLHESGIVYLSRFYRVLDRALAPQVTGPAAADLSYLKFAVFAGDNDTFSITYAVDSRDEELRKLLAGEAPFEAAAQVVDSIAAWRGPGVSDPITGVHVMAGLRNRYRPLLVDGEPVATGIIAVGDAAVCTNPLYGRGCSLALVHAFGLADTLREHGDDFDAVARSFSAFTERELVPWFTASVGQDEQARMRAAGEEYPAEDPRAFMDAIFRDGLMPALRTSPIVFRAFLRWFNLLTPTDALVKDPDVINTVMAAFQDKDNHPPMPVLGPTTRNDFLESMRR